MTARRHGWLPDPAHIVAAAPRASLRLAGAPPPPSSADLSPYEGPAPAQGYASTCCPTTVCDSIRTRALALGLGTVATVPLASILFAYQGGLAIDHSDGIDGGTYFSSVISAAQIRGLPSESLMTYSDDPALMFRKPSMEAFRAAYDLAGTLKAHRVFETDEDRERVVQQLIAAKIPVGVGLMIDQAFEDAEPGAVQRSPDPSRSVGGHAMKLKRYDRTPQGTARYWLRNWWGPSWCEEGEVEVDGSFLAACVDVWGFDLVGIPEAA